MVPQRMFGMTPWVRRLIVANLVVFLLQMTIFVNPWFVATFGFAPLDALARPWTFVSYAFIHANFLHLAFNLLALFVFGPPVEERMGGGSFLPYYGLCALGGAALSFALAVTFQHVHVVVAAAAARVRRGPTAPSVLVHPARAAGARAAPKPRRAEGDPAQAEVDRVLDKSSARGIESLTPAERRFLSQMSRKMRGRT